MKTTLTTLPWYWDKNAMNEGEKVICWWSGGVTSAVAVKLAIGLFGANNCRVVMIDTFNEDEDTYRFKTDCEKWYGVEIETITGIGEKYGSIQDVWMAHKSLNTATGAICSSRLKIRVREEWQKINRFSYQVFGFEFDKKEFQRASSMALNHPNAKPIFPLLMFGYDKEDCIRAIGDAGIKIPNAYRMGFRNNNCLKTGCVQGGIGYWQKMQREFPRQFRAMAELEHKLTELKGRPVTILKDSSKAAKKIVEDTGDKWRQLVFLKKHPGYPELKSLADMSPREVRPLAECNGFCSMDDFDASSNLEINYDEN